MSLKVNNLVELPTEILLHLFSFLEKQDLGRLAACSKQVKILAEDNLLWKNLILRTVKDAQKIEGDLTKQSYKEYATYIVIAFTAKLHINDDNCDVSRIKVVFEAHMSCKKVLKTGLQAFLIDREIDKSIEEIETGKYVEHMTVTNRDGAPINIDTTLAINYRKVNETLHCTIDDCFNPFIEPSDIKKKTHKESKKNCIVM